MSRGGPGPRLCQVIVVDEPRGDGTEGDPSRIVQVIYDTDGNWLGDNDHGRKT
jgi:hypothetical protein